MAFKINILLIEDYKPLRTFLVQYLQQNYKVYTAEDGIYALEIIKNNVIELVILDLMLPFPLDGFAILKILKNDANLSDIPVIIISAIDEDDKIELALENGANDFLIKPFSEKQLLLKINNLLSVKQMILKKVESEYIFQNSSVTPPKNMFEVDFKKRFAEVVEQFISNPNCNVPMLADNLSMSIASLERWVKKTNGMLPKQYILNCRLQKAEIMLRQRMGNVQDIAFELGFNSVSYFCTCFKKKFHQTPSDLLRSKK